MQQLGQDDVDHKQRQVVIINQDTFYRPLTEEENTKALKGEFNFDHPGTHYVYTIGQLWFISCVVIVTKPVYVFPYLVLYNFKTVGANKCNLIWLLI